MVNTETDIANLALSRCGAQGKIAAGALRTEDSNNAATLRDLYDRMRQYELRRNVWRFSIRTVAIRPIGDFSKLLTFATWSNATTYAINDVVLALDGQVYYSLVATNLANDPTVSPTKWRLYYGNLVAQEYVMTWSSAVTYDLRMHAVGSDGQVYRSIQNGNLNKNPVSQPTWWSLASTFTDPQDSTVADNQNYWSGEIVYRGRDVYISLTSNNDLDPGASSWLKFTAAPTLTDPNFIYPIGSGPSQQVTTLNVYRLPYAFMRTAPEDPKAGSTRFLGAPDALPYRDYKFEGDFIVTMDFGLKFFRFAADILDVSLFDPMFVSGFAHRLAWEAAEPLTQSSAKKAEIQKAYDKDMTDARIVNGIETGPTEPPEDDYITARY